MRSRWVGLIVPVLSILTIAGLELVALSMGMNGQMMQVAVGAIAGVGGYVVHEVIKR